MSRSASFAAQGNSLAWIVFTGILVSRIGAATNQFCPGLKASEAEKAQGTWFPSNCTNTKVPLGTQCYLKCKENYIFPAQARIEKQCVKTRNGQFTYGLTSSLTSCIGSPCPPLQKSPLSPGLNFHPDDCGSKHQAAKKTCHMTCQGNTIKVGGTMKSCLVNGTYSPVEGTFCKEKPPPLDVSCPPGSVTIFVESGKKTGDASGMVGMPTGTFDDSSVTISVRNSSEDIRKLPVGHYTVLFTIKGAIGQSPEYCNVGVTVKDDGIPYITTCPEEFEHVIPTGEKVKVGQLPFNFSDSADDKKLFLQYEGNIMGTYRGVGDYEQVITAVDSARNEVKCTISVKVRDGGQCKNMHPPENAKVLFSSMSHGNSLIQMYRSNCSAGHSQLCDVTLVPNIQFVNCYQGSPCTKELKIQFPLISCAVLLEKVGGSCPDRTQEISTGKCMPCPRSFFFDPATKKCRLCPKNETNFNIGSTSCNKCPANQMTKLETGPRFCENICADGYAYDASNKICTKCSVGTYVPSGGSTCINCPTGTTTDKKIATKKENCVCGKYVTMASGTAQMGSTTPCTGTKYIFRLETTDIPSNPIYQRYGISLESKQLASVSDCSSSFVQVIGEYRGFETALTEKLCGSGLKDPLVIAARPWRTHMIRYQWSSGATPDLKVTFGLANCTRGSYFNISTKVCTPCPKQTYQPTTGSVSCKPCPNGKGAPVEGAVKCIGGCPPGYFRNRTVCSACVIGTYQEGTEAMSCKKCDKGLSTAHTGTDSKAKCIGACGNGTFKAKDGSCKQCPVGTYQDKAEHAIKMCKYCPAGTVTSDLGGNSLQDCVKECHYEGEFFNKASSKCEKCPVGRYKLASPATQLSCTPCPTNYTTKRVGAVTKNECVKLAIADNCKSSPCKFPGRCVDTDSGYQCVCPALYEGTHCEKALYPCLKNPCKNGGTCYNQLATSYFCDCAPGWQGPQCTKEVRACDRDPCRNGGNCTNVGNTHKCTCPPYFSGIACHIRISKPCERRPCAHGKCTDGAFPGAVPSYYCTCYFDYTGKNCDTSMDDCASNPCSPKGTLRCKDMVSKFQCICKDEFWGTYCNQSKVCDPGYYYEYGCKPCSVGKYQAERVFTESCTACPSGTTTVKAASTDKKLCVDVDTTVKLKVTLRVISIAWNDDLLNRDSKLFKTTAYEVETQVKLLYSGEGKFVDVLVTAFAQGSVKSDMTLYFKDGVTDTQKPLVDAVKSGNVGNLRVDPKSIKVEEERPPKKKGKNTVIIVVVVLLVLLLICALAGYIIWTKKCRRRRSSFNKIDRKPYVNNSGSDSPVVTFKKEKQ